MYLTKITVIYVNAPLKTKTSKNVLIVFFNHFFYTIGCPTSGYYGFNCSSPCSEHCGSHCHIDTGFCHDCKPGYRGDRCEQGKTKP